MNILIAILVFGLLIFIHELGHFVVAKLSGITVYQFSIGFGPAIIKKQVGETLYAIRALPFGGAVSMKGEVDEDGLLTAEDKKGSFLYAPVWSRIAVAFAGSFMNFVLGLVLLLIIMAPVEAIPTTKITQLAPGFAYEEYLKEGDEILRVDDFKIYIYNDLLSALMLGEGEPYDLTVLRDGQKIKMQDVPLEKTLFDGEKAPRYGFSFMNEPANFGERMGYALDNTASFVQSVVISVKYMVTGQVKSDEIMGTVGITNEISSRAKQSMMEMWYFVAFLSVNLSVVNLLPIFGLDGGKLVFLFWEAITKKPIKPKYEAYLNAAGLLLLLGLFVFVTFNDISKLLGW